MTTWAALRPAAPMTPPPGRESPMSRSCTHPIPAPREQGQGSGEQRPSGLEMLGSSGVGLRTTLTLDDDRLWAPLQVSCLGALGSGRAHGLSNCLFGSESPCAR